MAAEEESGRFYTVDEPLGWGSLVLKRGDIIELDMDKADPSLP